MPKSFVQICSNWNEMENSAQDRGQKKFLTIKCLEGDCNYYNSEGKGTNFGGKKTFK